MLFAEIFEGYWMYSDEKLLCQSFSSCYYFVLKSGFCSAEERKNYCEVGNWNNARRMAYILEFIRI